MASDQPRTHREDSLFKNVNVNKISLLLALESPKSLAFGHSSSGPRIHAACSKNDALQVWQVKMVNQLVTFECLSSFYCGLFRWRRVLARFLRYHVEHRWPMSTINLSHLLPDAFYAYWSLLCGSLAARSGRTVTHGDSLFGLNQRRTCKLAHGLPSRRFCILTEQEDKSLPVSVKYHYWQLYRETWPSR